MLSPASAALAQAVAEPEAKAGEAADGEQEVAKASDIGPKVVSENSVSTRYKSGALIRTGSTRASNVLVTFPLPSNWPEQTVTIAEQTIPAIGSAKPRTLKGGVQQVIVKMPVVPANDLVEVSYTVDVVNRVILAPAEPQLFVLPKHTKKEVKPFLVASKNVDHQNGKLRKQAKEIIADHESAWDKTEAIYDWVRENIQAEETAYHSSQHTLKNLAGSNEDKTFLFVALCRAAKIPSRIVFTTGGAYAEFMLRGPGDDGSLHWFPCDVSGIREFGELSEPKLILQKGDGYKVPEDKKRNKLVVLFVTGKGLSPRIGEIHHEVFDDEEEE